MHDNIKYMLDKYNLKTVEAQQNALQEIIQEIVLLGLARGDFFKEAAFYGGTALRIFYGLDRFSEDLDFTALDKKFSGFRKYQKNVEMMLSAYGFEFTFLQKEKHFKYSIDSAFLKGNTSVNLLKIGVKFNQHKDFLIKIKLEIDTSPALGFDTEAKLQSEPEPHYIKALNLESLMAGKLQAILFRERKINVKGRDWYDLAWYLNKKIPYNYKYLSKKIQQSLKENPDTPANLKPISPENIQLAILKRLDTLDLPATKKDVIRFVKNPASLDIWSRKYFLELITRNLQPAR
jgi:predicted nucleotidyltransferase component of viral defense system